MSLSASVSPTRRHALKIAAAAAGLSAAGGGSALAGPVSAAQWEVFEIALKGPRDGNPFREVSVGATFVQGGREVEVKGFYDGEGVYKVRFMPDSVGPWRYRTHSSVRDLDGRTGQLTCTPARKGVRGPVGVRNTYHFGYADGTPFYPFGTTCYAWIHQSESMQQLTLESLAKGPFNKVRMCVFPKSYEYNTNEPPFYAFARDASGKHDFTRPNPAFFAHLERRILDLQALGIETDLILFHPYDRWGYATMSAADDEAYLRYIIARLSAYRSVWWSLANEYDFMKSKTTADFDRLLHVVEREDAVGHLRGIHNGKVIYDNTRPWVTHASVQGYERLGDAVAYRAEVAKPLVFDEVQYEGNLNRRWGNLSAEEMTWRSWRAVISGAYVTHGETLLDEGDGMSEDATPMIWWSTGGRLKGQSPARIGFLRKLVEEMCAPGQALAGLEPDPAGYYSLARCMTPDRKVAGILYFLDFHAPTWYEFPLPDDRYRAEIIDPWAMTITPVAGVFTGKSKLRLPGKAYQAVRFIRV